MDRRSFYHFIFFAFLLRHTLDQLKAASNKPVYQVRYGNWILMIIITIPTVVRAVAVHILCQPPEEGKIFVKCFQFLRKRGETLSSWWQLKTRENLRIWMTQYVDYWAVPGGECCGWAGLPCTLWPPPPAWCQRGNLQVGFLFLFAPTGALREAVKKEGILRPGWP